MLYRVAILGIYHESNTFVDTLTTLSDFKKGHYLKGEDIRKEYKDAHHEIGGMIEILEKEGAEVVPVFYAEATPGGMISDHACKILLQEMMDELDKILPVDACLVVPHGAAVSESYPDMDGHWLSLLRQKLGEKIPIVGTLDPHANVSQAMITNTQALIAYKTNPHVDQRQIGRDAGKLLMNVLRNEIKPLQVLMEIPLAISIEQQYTESEPCKSLYAFARELSLQSDILSVSVILGFPYADVKEMGTSVIVVADDNIALARQTCSRLRSYVIGKKETFTGSYYDIAYSIASLAGLKKPVLMLDMGDNVGGGSPGNSTYLLNALEQAAKYKAFVCIYDPQAVLQASACKSGDKFNVCIKNSNDELEYHSVRLVQLADGKFSESAPRHGGQANFDMGKIAIVSTENGTIVMLTSLRVAPFSLQQLTTFHIVPADFDVIVAKGVNAPIAAYSPVCPSIVKVNTPGITQADMTLFKYKNRRKPMYPFEIFNVF